jgi:putative RNA 2'-phosphotransferase
VDSRLVSMSKRLSWALRHDPASAGLILDPHGWVAVADVLAALELSRDALDAVVADNDKRRFVIEVSEGTERIRASQGHTVRVDLGLAPSTPPATLFHGTPEAYLASIRAVGLRPGGRHHVHLSADPRTAGQVGRRRRVPSIVLTVDASAMALVGYAFFMSANGVWLTDHVPPQFLSS